MKKEVGLWLDHRQAVIIITRDDTEEIKQITSDMEKHVRFADTSEASGAGISHTATTEDGRDRRFDNQLNRYYDELSTYLQDATAILIMGPGEAKGELQKRLESNGIGESLVTIKTTDKLTDEQIVAEVRRHFEDTQLTSKGKN